MTGKRFERIYADVDVFCRDHNAKGVSQLIERDDYDKIVERFNALHEEIEQLKDVNTQCCNDYSAMRRDVLQYKKENKQLKQRIKSRLHYYHELCNEFDKDDGFTYNIVKRIVEDLEDILK